MIELKSSEQIEKMSRASAILVDTFRQVIPAAKKGQKTQKLDKIARDFIESKGAKPAFLGYKGFPKSICTSINEEIVHGIPSERQLKEGDLLSVDIGVEFEGFFSDAAVTIAVGGISEMAAKLIKATKDALYNSIEAALEGNRISDVSNAVQQTAEKSGFSVIREFVGHGIGARLHEDPQIPNFGQPGMGIRIKDGMVFAIEPMICAGKWEAEILDDGWTAVTKDRSLTAHFEHTVAIVDGRPSILTEGIT
jgi:methionyl aminopeptidase